MLVIIVHAAQRDALCKAKLRPVCTFERLVHLVLLELVVWQLAFFGRPLATSSPASPIPGLRR
eukprot:2585199-Amphidinium_carterae.2